MALMKRKIAILGATGSIGTQALQVIDAHPESFEVVALTAHANQEALFDLVRKYRPQFAGLTSKEVSIPEDLRFCQWAFGETALQIAARDIPCHDVLVSVVGMVGLQSVLLARETNKRVLLANKEALVAGGHLVMQACQDQDGEKVLLPVDSEHSAIFQCLQGAAPNPFDSLILTASGGPFRTWPLDKMKTILVSDALKHPNWEMGQKITIDSASMFNKALEIIEAKWLFDAQPEQIQVVVHPQSIVHSMVVFKDQAMIAQLGMPDMRQPISYAMHYPQRLPFGGSPLRLDQVGTLSFEAPDALRFPALALAHQALKAGGAAACVLNAANEVAVAAFLKHAIAFLDIASVVEETLQLVGHLNVNQLSDVLHADSKGRQTASLLIKSRFSEGT